MNREDIENVVSVLINELIWEIGENPELKSYFKITQRLKNVRDQITDELVIFQNKSNHPTT